MKLIHQATIINEGKMFVGSVLIEKNKIAEVYADDVPENIMQRCSEIINARGLYLIPGVIDDQVHFREPGLTQKGDLYSESRAAVAGGVTSFMEMPNTDPQAVSLGALEQKFELASEKSAANYSFFLGATNDNIKELLKVDKKNVCGVKVFMGSSTGNMLVDNHKVLQQIFAEVDTLIATHCEKEDIIKANIEHYKKEFGEDIPIDYHSKIRSDEACYVSSAEAIELADKYGAKLHVLHLSTAREMALLSDLPIKDKKITGEVCVHHLWFTDDDYAKYGTLIKWNPAVKTQADRDALRASLNSGKLDVVATDHAPHLLSEKEGGSLKAASGGPLVQHSLQAMLQMSDEGLFTKELVVEKMCHAPADLFQIEGRGYIRKGYYADLVLVNPKKSYQVSKNNILYKCGWSPFEGVTFSHTIERTFVNGQTVFDNGKVVESSAAMALTFDR